MTSKTAYHIKKEHYFELFTCKESSFFKYNKHHFTYKLAFDNYKIINLIKIIYYISINKMISVYVLNI